MRTTLSGATAPSELIAGSCALGGMAIALPPVESADQLPYLEAEPGHVGEKGVRSFLFPLELWLFKKKCRKGDRSIFRTVDPRGWMTVAGVAELTKRLQAALDKVGEGYRVRNELTRPPKQREWGGPHIHIDYNGPNSGKGCGCE